MNFPSGFVKTQSSISVTFFQVFISNGWMSDVVIVVAVTNREAKTAAHGISLFLVDAGTKGFQKGRKLEKIGLKAQVPLKPSIYIRSVLNAYDLPSYVRVI